MKNLLDEVYKLVNLEIFFISILEHEWSKAVTSIITCTLPLWSDMPIILFFTKLLDVMILKKLLKIIYLVIVLWLFNLILHMRRDHCHHEIIESLEYISLLQQIIIEESLSILTIQNKFLVWTATKFHYFKELVIVIHSWKYGYLDKHFYGSAS